MCSPSFSLTGPALMDKLRSSESLRSYAAARDVAFGASPVECRSTAARAAAAARSEHY